jgi:exonuclease III
LAAISAAAYGAVWDGQRSWNGVAILARGSTPVLTRRTMPGDPADDQARYIEAAVNGVLIASIYLPNGNPQPGPKLAWFERLAAGVPAVLAGDYNVVPTEADIWPAQWNDAVGEDGEVWHLGDFARTAARTAVIFARLRGASTWLLATTTPRRWRASVGRASGLM